MNFKTLALAGSLAMSASFVHASAISDDGSTTLAIGDSEVFTFVTDSGAGGPGDFLHTFTVDGDGTGEMLVSILPTTAGLFDGLTLSWLDASDDSVIDSIAFSPVVTSLSTVFSSPDTLSQKMALTWSDSDSGLGFDGEVHISVSAVPLPAGVVLLGTGLGGIMVARRRKKVS